jgi:aspartate/methionine/tyrosine aminotransferase
MKFQQYPFEKLNNLLNDIIPNSDYNPITLTIGEPQFDTPTFIQNTLKDNSALLNKYPKTAGEVALKEAQRAFVKRRFNVTLDDSELLPTFGTREVLFNFPQFFLFDKENPAMAFTNPFYQIYEGAAIAARADRVHLNLTKNNNFKADIDPDMLKECDLVIINYPNNPTASELSMDELQAWAQAALEYDFVLINDECYSEIYKDSPPPSLLQAAKNIGNESLKNTLVLNSISKRSSAPGLRSGFIAGDRTILKEYLTYRTYVGCASPLPLQAATAAAWNDEAHVQEARENYKKNFEIAKAILGTDTPNSTFYIWLEVDDDIEFTQKLYREKNVKVLPGSYLSREDIGEGYIRIALVESPEKTKEALTRIKEVLQ